MQTLLLASVAHDAASKAFCTLDGEDDPEAVRGLRRSETRLCAGWRRNVGVWGTVAPGWAQRGHLRPPPRVAGWAFDLVFVPSLSGICARPRGSTAKGTMLSRLIHRSAFLTVKLDKEARHERK